MNETFKNVLKVVATHAAIVGGTAALCTVAYDMLVITKETFK